MAMDKYRAANLANWDERVEGHLAPDGYNVAELVDDSDYLTHVVRFDRQRLGDVSGRTLLHSQCHIGTDTLSWAKLGAQVTGLDFSPKAIEACRNIAQRLGIEATFVETEFYDAPDHIAGQFDIVYTSVGAICWLPDIDRWGEVLADFLKPGGTFYIRDTHPVVATLDDLREDQELVMTYDYFRGDGPIQYPDEPESYLGSATLTNLELYEWPHTIADVMNSLIRAGLTIERVEELQHLDWAFFNWMEESDGAWSLPADLHNRLPLQFSVTATKPA
ncbi:MAG: class I SAM-dependent methyltransferase [Acidimicrobiales bacterium]